MPKKLSEMSPMDFAHLKSVTIQGVSVEDWQYLVEWVRVTGLTMGDFVSRLVDELRNNDDDLIEFVRKQSQDRRAFIRYSLAQNRPLIAGILRIQKCQSCNSVLDEEGDCPKGCKLIK